jgi:hypothetical protein
MRAAGFTGCQYDELLTAHQSQAKPAKAIHYAGLFLLIFPPRIKHPRTRFYRLTNNIFIDFRLHTVAQVGIFNLPVGLAYVSSSILVE